MIFQEHDLTFSSNVYTILPCIIVSLKNSMYRLDSDYKKVKHVKIQYNRSLFLTFTTVQKSMEEDLFFVTEKM
jgi:hypothetical protein